MKQAQSQFRDEWLVADAKELVETCEIQTFRGSGPGGQKRNKTSSGVRLIHSASGCSAVATELRSQKANLDAAVVRLKLEIAFAYRSGRQVHVLEEVGPNHVAFASHVARLLDALHQHDWSLRDTAAACGTTTGQITKMICADPRVHAEVNRCRALLNLKPLRARD